MSVKVVVTGGRGDGKSTVSNLIYNTLKQAGFDVTIGDGEETQLHKDDAFKLPTLDDMEPRKVTVRVKNK